MVLGLLELGEGEIVYERLLGVKKFDNHRATEHRYEYVSLKNNGSGH